jgi:hypothetical protein
MLRAVAISVVIGTFLIGMYYVVAATYVQPIQQDKLAAALDDLQPGLSYEKLISLDEEERYYLIQQSPSNTRQLILGEAANHPSFITESKDQIKEISNSAELRLLKLTPIAGIKGFSAYGTAGIFDSGDMLFLRLEGFSITSGIDQHVYLTKDASVSTGIDLGRLKATEGEQNYDITGIDTELYNILIIYSKTFDTYYAHARFLKAE